MQIDESLYGTSLEAVVWTPTLTNAAANTSNDAFNVDSSAEVI